MDAGLSLTPMQMGSWKIPHPRNISGASQQNNITALQDSTTHKHLNKVRVAWMEHFLFSYMKF